MFETAVIFIVIIALCVVLLAVRLFFGKPFVSMHIDESQAMKQQGIDCVVKQDWQQRHSENKPIKERKTKPLL